MSRSSLEGSDAGSNRSRHRQLSHEARSDHDPNEAMRASSWASVVKIRMAFKSFTMKFHHECPNDMIKTSINLNGRTALMSPPLHDLMILFYPLRLIHWFNHHAHSRVTHA